MPNRMNENNIVHMSGEIGDKWTYNHQAYGEGFYMTTILVERTSGVVDEIPIMVSDRLIDVKEGYIGKYAEVKGQFRSFNFREDGKAHLNLYVFCTEITFEEEIPWKKNDIFLDGYLCKEPVYRKTPLGREITELLIAVNRLYKKTDYIPCICWSRNARWASSLEVGNRIQIHGRIQSRIYSKRISEEEYEQRVAYEVSIREMEALLDEKRED